MIDSSDTWYVFDVLDSLTPHQRALVLTLSPEIFEMRDDLVALAMVAWGLALRRFVGLPELERPEPSIVEQLRTRRRKTRSAF